MLCTPAQRPVILTGPTEQKVAKDRNVTIPCGVEGKPRPDVMWYKGDQRLLGERYKILPNGDLQIKVIHSFCLLLMLENRQKLKRILHYFKAYIQDFLLLFI